MFLHFLIFLFARMSFFFFIFFFVFPNIMRRHHSQLFRGRSSLALTCFRAECNVLEGTMLDVQAFSAYLSRVRAHIEFTPWRTDLEYKNKASHEPEPELLKNQQS